MLFHASQRMNHASHQSRILVLEDDPLVFRLIEAALECQPYELIHADNVQQATALLKSHRPHLIILDYHLPEMNGLEWLSTVLDQMKARLCPVILITGDEQKNIREQAYRIGVMDCIRKPLEIVEFESRIQKAIEYRDIQQSLITEALTDPTTGLLTRQCLEQVEDDLKICQDHNSYLTAIDLDIDYFQAVNESFGRKAADQVLIDFSHRLKHYDLNQRWIIRMSGDHFIVIMQSNLNTQQIMALTEELNQCLCAIYQIRKVKIQLSCSMGIQHIPQSSLTDLDSLLKQSDQALNHAKTFHRGECIMFNDTIRIRSELRACVEKDLEKAIKDEQFYLTFQPVVHADFQKIKSYEVLLRWEHPEHGHISPAEFIPAAELLGKMPILGKWVIEQTCKVCHQELGNEVIDPPHFHINASRQELAQPGYSRDLLKLLYDYQVPTSSISIEVTETYACNKLEQIKKNLIELNHAGISIALDDFGQGQSALNSIHELPINCLKIDRAFISGISHDRKRISILKFIIDMAHDLHLDVVAEGVENTDQLCTLQSLGCRYLQGYLLGRPERTIKKTITPPQHYNAMLIQNSVPD